LAREIKSSLLPLLSIRRPVTVVMVLLCTLVLGVISYNRIRLQLIPEGFTPMSLWVDADYGAQANPYEVEKQLTRPLEEMLRTVRGLSRIRSNSRQSSCSISLEFDQRVNMKEAYAQVRDRIERARPQLPETLRQVNIWKFSESDIPIIYFTFNVPENIDDAFNLTEKKIKRALERVDGVARVNFWGLEEKQIYIDLDRDRLEALGVDLYSLVERMRQDNFALSSGYLVDGGTKFMVRSMARFPSVESIENLPIGVAGLHLSDVAVVSYRSRPRTFFMRTDQQPTISGEVSKESMANTVEVAEAVTRVLNEELPSQPGLEGLKFNIFFNQGDWIKDSVDNIKQTCLWGGIFAVLILFFFLRSLRMTVIVTLAIPLALLFTVIVMYFIGWSLNVFTMMGIMISIGMVVDNSIVVVENIYRMRLEGMQGAQAAVDGASEVSLAITMSTLTTVVVFLPLILMNQDREFTFIMARLGLPVMVALLASLVVALFFIPQGTLRLTPREQIKERPILHWLNDRYIRILSWTLRHRLDAALVLVVLLASSFYPMKHLRKYDWRERERMEIYVNFDLPENSSWDRTHRFFQMLEDFMTERKSRYRYETLSVRYSRTWGVVELFRPLEKRQWYDIAYRNLRKTLGSPVDSELTYQEVIEELNDSLPRFAGTRVTVNWKETSEKDPTINLVLYGDDIGTLVELAGGVKQRLSGVPGLAGVDTENERGNEEIRVQIDRNISRQYGLDARRIASTVAYGGGGMRLNEFRTSEKEIQMYLQFSDTDSTTLHKLRNTPLYSSTGQKVPLGTVARFTMQKGMGQIRRDNGKTFLRVRGTATKEDLQKTFANVDKAMEGFEMPRGYNWDKGSQYSRVEQKEAAQHFGIILAVTFVFLLMGVLFESFVLPLSVIIAIPFSFFGAYWALFITDTPFDEMSAIGLIILVGVVVNNAIVLVDMIQRFRTYGLDRTTALLEAGKHRFRPILMTAATTIGGLVPIAVGGAKFIDTSYAPMGRTMIGGLLTSTLITLVAVPLLYTFLDDLRGLGSKIGAGFFKSSR